MRSLIIGGAGFIGSHLAHRLIKLNHKVTIIDNLTTGREKNIEKIRNKIKFIKCDISKDKNLAKYFNKVDWIFHLAALADIVPSIVNPKSYFDSNVQGTLNVLQACRKYKPKKFIYSASSSCYGIPKKYPTSETSEIDVQYPYALTKRLGEELVMHWHQVYKLQAISLRLFNVYGTKSRTSGTYGAMFGVFLAQKIAKLPFTVVGDGKQKRDFTYVSDVVNAMITAAKSNFTGEIFNVGSGKKVSINKIVKLLGGKKIYIPKRPGEPDCTFADIKKIKKYLKWYPKVTIEEGVEILKQNINDWKDAPVWTKDKINIATKEWFKYLKR